MRTLSKSLVIVAFLAVLPACKTVQPFVVSGQVLNTLGQEFVHVAAEFEAGFASGKISSDAYGKFREFGMKFQAAYPAAVHLWQLSVLTNDKVLESQSLAIIADLMGPLADFAQEVNRTIKELQQ